MSSKYTDFFEPENKNEKNQESNNTKQVSFDDSYSLPKHVKSREDVEKGFRDYLSHKEEDRRRGYISPPFEVSKVASPIYGYHKPKKEVLAQIKYDKLKTDMEKSDKDLILYEEFVTEELETIWNSRSDNTFKESGDYNSKQLPKLKAKKLTKKAFGLNRTLESIMEEEKSGNNSERRNVPGLFSGDRDTSV